MSESQSELLLLSDGRILVHNLTPALAEVLDRLNLERGGLKGRTAGRNARPARRKQQPARQDESL